MMYHSLRGIGDCIDDPTGPGCVTLDTGGATVDATGSGGMPGTSVVSTNVPDSFFGTFGNSTAGSTVSGNASSGFNWGNLFTPLVDAAAQVGTVYAAEQTLKPGQTLTTGPNGQLMVTSATAPSALSTSLASNMPLILLGGGALLLVMAMKKH